MSEIIFLHMVSALTIWERQKRSDIWGRPRTHSRDYIFHLALKYLGIIQKELEDMPGENEIWPENRMDSMLMFNVCLWCYNHNQKYSTLFNTAYSRDICIHILNMSSVLSVS